MSGPLLCTRKSLAVLRFPSATTKFWVVAYGRFDCIIFFPNSLVLISLVKSEVTRVSQRSQQRLTGNFHRTVFGSVITTDTIFDQAIRSKYSMAQTLSMAWKSTLSLTLAFICLNNERGINSQPDKMTSFCFVSPCAETIKACLHGSGGPQIGEVTCAGHPTYHVNVIKLK